MAPPKDIDGSASVPAFYGKELRFRREQAGLTLQQTVEGSFYGASYLSEIERATRRMPVDLARHVDRLLSTDGFFERRCEDVRNARRGGHAQYFERVLNEEKNADAIEEWSPTLIPGLLQTREYARAVILATHPESTDEDVEEKVSARLERAQLFADSRRTPMVWMIVSEILLHQPMLPAGEMAEQLAHVSELARLRRVVPQILPWNRGPHPLMAGMAKVVTFPDAPPLVYLESQYTGDTIDDPSVVKQYSRAYDRLRAAALPPETSLALIERAADDYRDGRQRTRLV
ncbi:helix-turn-helix transcriptional regulator [Streptomyces sp. NPDC047968]|uniref:helix-turn-helix domain-containing protein n=1 Tax=unclassified Streptomyces TaxID=2593676 RepID=UPI0034352533